MLEAGVYPAAITPFDERGQVDMPSVARLLAYFRSRGCSGVVLAGTNGEGPSLSAVEKRDLVRQAVPILPDFPVILGIATPSLTEAIWLSQQAHRSGAAAVLVMPPAYFREATVDGLLDWYRALMDASECPVLVYNFPARTGITLSAEFMAALADHPRMIGLKDSSGDRANLPDYAAALAGREKRLFVGDESLLTAALDHGWTGTISGLANVASDWLDAVIREHGTESGEVKQGLVDDLKARLKPFATPMAYKHMLSTRGIIAHPAPRLPLVPLSKVEADQVSHVS